MKNSKNNIFFRISAICVNFAVSVDLYMFQSLWEWFYGCFQQEMFSTFNIYRGIAP